MLQRGWDPQTDLGINKVFKVHHDDQVIKNFEDCRQITRVNALKSNERLMANGNEILCFRGTSLTCNPGSNGKTCVCNEKSCGACRLIRKLCCSSLESLWPISLSLNCWRAHEKASKKCGKSSGPCRRSKAIVVCRVIAGCIGHSIKNESLECEETAASIDSALLSTGDNWRLIIECDSTRVGATVNQQNKNAMADIGSL
ncbi:hypothetical protein Ancab_002761 [Ancistrocladus abbreviatus]